jgi:hypothetical protein
VITLSHYAGKWRTSPDWTTDIEQNALRLLTSVNALEAEMARGGIRFPDNPKTNNGISGELYGGFRPQDCPIGAPLSNHKTGKAIDRYDPHGLIDAWCMAHQDRIAWHGIWIEHPDATPGWSHWQSVSPRSGNRVFKP